MPRIDRNKVADIANKASLFATRARRYYQIGRKPKPKNDTAGQHDTLEAAWRLATAIRPIRDTDTEGRKRFPAVYRQVQLIRDVLRDIEDAREWWNLETVKSRQELDELCRIDVANPIALATVKQLEAAAATLAEEAAHWPGQDSGEFEDIAPPKERKRPGRKSAEHLTVNQQMRAIVEKDHASHAWTLQQWADRLGCAKSTAWNTGTWRSLDKLRAATRAELAIEKAEKALRSRE